MKKTITQLTVALSVTMLASCASIVSKTSYPIIINSQPAQSSILITNSKGLEIYTGTTPATVTLRSSEKFFKKAEYQVRFTKDGYEEKVVPLTCKVDGWYWGNLVFGGLIGFLIVDPGTGAMYKFEQEFLTETLMQSSVNGEDEPKLKIYELGTIPAHWKEHLVLLETK